MSVNFGVHAQSTIKEDIQSIKTYPYSDPNPIPSVALNNDIFRFYPYFVFDGYTNKSTQKDWKIITLENPYIQVKVLPEVGGKVWGAIEKSTGEEFVYLNEVMKFRAIGIRGPWTSGGIEHNFGLDLGHAPWTSASVDYITQENKDGSVSVIVGGLDLASRTQWRVDIRLPKGKAYFKTTSLWYNPNPLHDSYLAWENAGFKATDDLQFFYPGNQSIFHDGSATPWPIDSEGHDLSKYKENNFGGHKSYHVMGTYNNWFGGYWHDSDFGFGHWALYDEAPGKKIWLWSLARQGGIWEDLLTDTDGQYMEAQAGVKLNQAGPKSGFHSPFNQLSLRPDQSDTKTDVWFPVKKTNGMSDASPYGTLNIVPSDTSIDIHLSANSTINDSLFVQKGTEMIYAQHISLKPTQTFQKTIPIEKNKPKGLTVTLGQNKLSSTVGEDIYEKNNLKRPVKSTIVENYDSPAQLFREAEDENAMREYDKALQHYLDILEKEPSHNAALSRVAEIYYRKAQYHLGAEYARKALETDTYNPDANYIYGALLKKLGNLTQAEEAFSIASQSMKYRSGAYAKIAGINLQKRKFQKATIYAQKSLNYNKYNLNAYEYLGTGFRKQEKKEEAKKVFKKLLQIDPLNHYARFEQYLLDPSEENRSQFNDYIRNEFPEQTYLELALQYAVQEGLQKEAINILKQAPSYPMVNYWLGYLHRSSSPSRSMEYLKKALQASPDFVFPFRLESLSVLQWAQEQTNSWKTNYYLGLIYWSKLRYEKAGDLFQSIGNEPDYAPFYMARGRLLQEAGSNVKAITDYKRAKKLDPSEWRASDYLTNYYLQTDSSKKQLNNADQAYDRFPDNAVIGISYAKALYISNNYKKALQVLESIQVLPQEHAREGQTIYEQICLALALKNLEEKKYQKALDYIAKSRKYPENLGTGKPFDPDVRLQDYTAAYIQNKLGNQRAADNLYKEIKKYTLEKGTKYHHGTPTDDAAGIYIGAKVLKMNGQKDKAQKYVDKWATEQDSLKNWRIAPGSSALPVQWTIAKVENKEQTAEKLGEKIYEETVRDKFQIFLGILTVINN